MSAIDAKMFDAIAKGVAEQARPQPSRSVLPFRTQKSFDEVEYRKTRRFIRKAYAEARVMDAEGDQTRELMRLGDDIHMAMALFKLTAVDEPISTAEAWEWVLSQYMGAEYHEAVKGWLKDVAKWDDGRIEKALDSAESGGGADFVPSNYSSELIADYRNLAVVANLHRHVRMTSPTFDLPLVGSAVKYQKLSENTGDNTHTESNFITAVDPNTLSPSLSAVKLGMRVVVSEEIVEDSIIPMIPFITDEAKEAAAHGLDTAVINGDTAGTHMDNDVAGGASTLPQKAFLGYRGAAMDQTPSTARVSMGNGKPTAQKIDDIIAAMGRFGTRPSDLAFITSPKGRVLIKGIPEKRLVQYAGEKAASAPTGEIGEYEGSSFHVSDEFPTNLHDTGVNTSGGDNDTTGFVVVNKKRWVFGDYRDLRLKVVDREESDQKVLVMTERIAFKQLGTTATDLEVGYGYNMK